jgi:hypothetical protein
VKPRLLLFAALELVKRKEKNDEVGSEDAGVYKSLLFEHAAQQLTYCIRYTALLS